MKEIIKVVDILGSQLRIRQSVRSIINDDRFQSGNSIILDFIGVQFMSRSFADELYGCVKSQPVKLVNMSEEVATMYKVVKESRAKNIKKLVDMKSVIDFNSIDDLSAYLATF